MEDLTLKEAQKLLLIDKYALDIVCVEQPELFSRIALAHSKAVNLRDKGREDLVIGDAEISNSLRLTSEKTEMKLTEAKLSLQVVVHETHIKNNEEYLELKLEADQWSALRESFLQRASMIKLLCELYLSDYFSTKSVTSNKIGDEVMTSKIKKRQTLHRQKKAL